MQFIAAHRLPVPDGGIEFDDVLRRVRRAVIAVRCDEWLASQGLPPFGSTAPADYIAARAARAAATPPAVDLASLLAPGSLTAAADAPTDFDLEGLEHLEGLE